VCWSKVQIKGGGERGKMELIVCLNLRLCGHGLICDVLWNELDRGWHEGTSAPDAKEGLKDATMTWNKTVSSVRCCVGCL
jgi:hypothetical protein